MESAMLDERGTRPSADPRKHDLARPVGHRKASEWMSASVGERMRPQGVPDLGPLRSMLNNASELFRKGKYGGPRLTKA